MLSTINYPYCTIGDSVIDMVTLCALGHILWVRDAIIVLLSAEDEFE